MLYHPPFKNSENPVMTQALIYLSTTKCPVQDELFWNTFHTTLGMIPFSTQ